MATQMNVYASDGVAVVPSALLVLLTILGMLGIIVNVAMA